jgi:hypothetical protein
MGATTFEEPDSILPDRVHDFFIPGLSGNTRVPILHIIFIDFYAFLVKPTASDIDDGGGGCGDGGNDLEILYAIERRKVVDSGNSELEITGKRPTSICETPTVFGHLFIYMGMVHGISRCVIFDL